MERKKEGERARHEGGREGRKENKRGREMTLPDVKQNEIQFSLKKTSAEFCNPACQH